MTGFREFAAAGGALAALAMAAALAGVVAAGRAGAQGTGVPLPPPPPGTALKKPTAPAPQQAPAPQAPAQQVPGREPPAPAAAPPKPPAPAVKVPTITAPAAQAPGQERCVTCHGPLLRRRVVHQAVQPDNCNLCHKPSAKAGKCQSKAATGWVLTKDQPDLCYSCHKRKDTLKEVHTAIRVGECLECHAAHASDLPALAKRPREQMCFSCHEYEGLVAAAVKHAPVGEGKCLDCHDPHGTGKIAMVKSTLDGNLGGVSNPVAVTAFTSTETNLRNLDPTTTANDGVCDACHRASGEGTNTPPKSRWRCST